MAQVSIPGGLWIGPNFSVNTPPQFTDVNCSAAAHKAAAIIPVPRSGTLDKFEAVLDINSAPANGIRFSFQDVDGSGDPDGTQDQFRDVTGLINGNNQWIVPGLMTSDGTDGGVKRVVTAGQYLACVLEFTSFLAGNSFDGKNYSIPNIAGAFVYGYTNYTDRFLAAWTKGSNTMMLVLKYDDGTYAHLLPSWLPILNFVSTTYNSGSTPDERALRFQIPYDAILDGCSLYADVDGPLDIVLYDAASVELASTALVAANRPTTASSWINVKFPQVAIAANTTYRIGARPSSVTNITLNEFTVANTALMNAIDGGPEWYLSTRTDAGAWTDTTTQRPWGGIHLVSIDTGAASGLSASHVLSG